ncbi:MAG: hypothetical protein J6D54_02760, partial [Olsenella sp.]|nr:hypothetical protein [Olsenella sp.]
MIEGYRIQKIDRAEVLRYLGHTNQELGEELDARLDDAIVRCLELARPRAVTAIFDVGERATLPGGMPVIHLLGCSLKLVGNSMRKHMSGATKVGVMAVTIGMAVERELRRLSLTNGLDQALFDAAATTLVERAADAAEATIVARAHELGLFTNARFSPGYGDMPLETQPTLLDTLDARRRLGITLSPSLLMTPTKSITAVVGLF